MGTEINKGEKNKADSFKQAVNVLSVILRLIFLPYSLSKRFKKIKLADECISTSGNSELIKKSQSIKANFIATAIVASVLSLSFVATGATLIYFESKDPIKRILDKKKFMKQSSTKTRKFLIKKLNTKQNHVGVALLLVGLVFNVIVIRFDRDAEKTKLLQKFLEEKVSTEFKGTESFYCYGGYVVLLTTQTQREIAETKSLWAALGTTASIDSTLSHPSNNRIALFRRKFELEKEYKF